MKILSRVLIAAISCLIILPMLLLSALTMCVGNLVSLVAWVATGELNNDRGIEWVHAIMTFPYRIGIWKD